LPEFNQNLTFYTEFKKKKKKILTYKISQKFCPVGAELFLTDVKMDRRTDRQPDRQAKRHNEAYRFTSQFCEHT